MPRRTVETTLPHIAGRWTRGEKVGRRSFVMRCTCGRTRVMSSWEIQTLTPASRCAACANKETGRARALEAEAGHQFINELGHVYGDRVVIGLGPRYKSGGFLWLCRCRCGDESYVSGVSLRQGKSLRCRSCASKLAGATGRYKAQVPPTPQHDVVAGAVVGFWHVLDPADRDAHGNPRWRCRCRCGTEQVVRDSALRYGASGGCRSCRQPQGPGSHQRKEAVYVG